VSVAELHFSGTIFNSDKVSISSRTDHWEANVSRSNAPRQRNVSSRDAERLCSHVQRRALECGGRPAREVAASRSVYGNEEIDIVEVKRRGHND
jgi:hypothetical protein